MHRSGVRAVRNFAVDCNKGDHEVIGSRLATKITPRCVSGQTCFLTAQPCFCIVCEKYDSLKPSSSHLNRRILQTDIPSIRTPQGRGNTSVIGSLAKTTIPPSLSIVGSSPISFK